ncbi:MULTISPECIES: DUF1697 domain-containing protein [unclassified Streptomyces]|uniref:DUF1697 domain-containing protein n=1 Tax=unclassified Streptomyces TaxID=2593676 RepID=UPI000DAC05A6|nr:MULTISPECIES: DUF1697 domain-containing protein [unclassified Streptomyces]PZT73510.1 DUF1697 domain-containing protein [Streptomyces sp. AC1-42T]PZT83497.1 DUF1697 domain-containing protein [Streptomyces sp. AC1-42W]WUC92362.1 DUF1697 domain-containing protein [Streptomyces sp. NBC_00525]
MLYIALLRGLNVPGRSVKMERLRELFTELGLASVRSYIQSGNVFFESGETDRPALAARIGDHLARALGYDVAVCLRTVPELEALIARDPFQDVEATDDIRRCVVFTTEPVDPDLELPLLSPKKDMEIIGTTAYEAFVVWHLINGRAPGAKGFQESVLGHDATTRFFHTVVKILAAAKKGAA